MFSKPRIVIFGASRGGISAFHYFKRDHDIIAFADNDLKKQGQELMGKPIVAANNLLSLNPDKIVIASLYALQIHRQLVIDQGIENQRIVRLPATFFDKAHPLYFAAAFTVAVVVVASGVLLAMLLLFGLQYCCQW
jgi:FlaA1/EpsC-like NDP-sugar epimerase